MAVRLGLSLMAGAVIWAALWFGGPLFLDRNRSLTYDAGAPRDWPILYDLRLNGADMIPWGFEVVAWTGDTSYAGGGSVAGGIPTKALFNRDDVDVHVAWMEWATGAAWTAEFTITHPEDLRAGITVHFEADGQVSVYRPGAALRAGGLGRVATLDDYERIGRGCGTPLAADDPVFRDLLSAAEANEGIDARYLTGAALAPPPPSSCTPPAQ